ncbi:2-dehydro-3-deoxygluconokinase [Marivirga lumbricoides]|uniref:2-dehydro-3-deoxygluconokinase n=1 Tax=Marivirga lumbricoides TaxID=1046115 RepID=A0ABQ1MVC6_9BACT|nr:2-dehydro-3-deoxygluconokinase [Marivirga lumbricoides]
MTKILCLGEILLRFQAEDYLKFLQSPTFKVHVGGSEANVAVALAQLNWSAGVLSALPEHDLADQAINYYRGFSLNTNHIYRLGSRMATYFMEQGAAMRGSKIIYDRAHAAINELTIHDVDWDAAFEGVTHFHWSAITPALSANTAELCAYAVQKAKDKKCHISADLHFRKNLWQFTEDVTQIMLPLIKSSDTINGDPFTWQQLTGMSFGTDQLAREAQPEDFESIYKNIQSSFPNVKHFGMLVRKIHHANHNSLTGLILSENDFVLSKKIEVNPIIERIGGGDAFMAGLLYGLESGNNLNEAINFATAISAIKHTILGDVFVGKLADVEEVITQTVPGKINR